VFLGRTRAMFREVVTFEDSWQGERIDIAGDRVWSLCEVSGRESLFEWETLGRILTWVDHPARKPFDFQAFAELSPADPAYAHYGPSAIVFGILPDRRFFGYFGERHFSGDSIATSDFDRIVAAMRSLYGKHLGLVQSPL
jgi:hypothetical protein